MRERGYLEGKEMAMAFNMLRANDFDLELRCRQLSPREGQPTPFEPAVLELDSTRMPVEMHNFYLRTVYHENRLAKPGGESVLQGSRYRLTCRLISPWLGSGGPCFHGVVSLFSLCYLLLEKLSN